MSSDRVSPIVFETVDLSLSSVFNARHGVLTLPTTGFYKIRQLKKITQISNQLIQDPSGETVESFLEDWFPPGLYYLVLGYAADENLHVTRKTELIISRGMKHGVYHYEYENSPDCIYVFKYGIEWKVYN